MAVGAGAALLLLLKILLGRAGNSSGISRSIPSRSGNFLTALGNVGRNSSNSKSTFDDRSRIMILESKTYRWIM
jgi:hypothetical protein